MSAFSAFYNLVLPYADGAGGPAMDNALRNAAIEFCGRTCVWQQVSDLESVSANVNTYDIEKPNDAEVVKIMTLSFDKKPIDMKSADELDMLYAEWTETTSSVPSYYTQLTPSQFILVPMPSEDKASVLAYRAAYKPSQTARALPNILYEQYAMAIAHGALKQLLSESNRGYYAPQEAMKYDALFENKILEVALAVSKSFGRAPKRVRGQFF